jgi:hypothetical protein
MLARNESLTAGKDLISYKVTQTDPIQLSECVEGTGKLRSYTWAHCD